MDHASGSTYKFRVSAVYSNGDNRQSGSSRKFKLQPTDVSRPATPRTEPGIVEVQSLGTDNLALRWHVSGRGLCRWGAGLVGGWAAVVSGVGGACVGVGGACGGSGRGLWK